MVDGIRERGRYYDIIIEALLDYDEWMKDDDYNSTTALNKIMKRMRERLEMSDPPLRSEVQTAEVARVAEAIRLRSCERGYPVHPNVAHHLAAAALEAMPASAQGCAKCGGVNCRDCGKPIDVAYILQHPRSCIVCDPEFGDPRDSRRPAQALPTSSPHVEYSASRGQSKVTYWVSREEGDRIRAAAVTSQFEGASCGDAQGLPVGPKAGSRPAAPSSSVPSAQGNTQ